MTQNFTQGKILSPLVRFAMPVLLAVFLQTMYGAVDMLVIGQFSPAAEISAVSTGSWVMQCVTQAIVGISMGTTVLLGRRIGEGRPEEAGNVVGSSIVLFAVLGLGMTVGMELSARAIAVIMQVPEEAFRSTVSYIRICSAGSVFIVAYNVIGSVFRGLGNSKLPLVTVAIACAANILGDLLLVGVFRMAAAGAALATVAAQAISVVISLGLIRRQGVPFAFGKSNLRLQKNVAAWILKLGIPIAFQDVLVSISFLAITAIVNGLGVIPSAGVGVAEKICGFVMLVPSAFSQSVSAFVAQNIGADQPDRARKAMLYSILVSLGIGVGMAYLSFFHGQMLAGIFNRDREVVAAAADYLKSYAIDCLLVSVMFCMTGYFSGRGNTAFVMLQGIAGAFGVRLPVSFLMSKVRPVSLFRIGLATPCSTALQILLCLVYYAMTQRSERRPAAK